MSEIPKPKNPAAVALGRLNAGKPRQVSEAERERRAQRMRDYHAKLKLAKAGPITQTQTHEEKAT